MCRYVPALKVLYAVSDPPTKINGTRSGASPTNGGANIEMGGANSGQLVEYVRSFDPRSWSCLVSAVHSVFG